MIPDFMVRSRSYEALTMVDQGDGSCKTEYEMRWMWKGSPFLKPLSFVRLSGRIVLFPDDLLYGS
jgi:hypothetical protein